MNTVLYVQLSNLLYAVAVASVIMVIVTMSMQDANALLASLVGYSSMFASVFFLAVLSWMYFRNESMMSRFWTYLPFLMTLLPLFFIVLLMSLSFSTIASGNVAPSYTSLLVSATLFLVVQMGILFRGVVKARSRELLPSSTTASSSGSTTNAVLTPMTTSVVNLLGTISLFLVASLSVVLRYYNTQG